MSSAAEARERKDWPHLLSAGAHVGAVLGILVLGAVFQSRSPAARTPTATPERALAAPALETPHPPPLAERAPDPVAATSDRDARIAARAVRDAARLARAGAGYTLQIAMLCDAAGVRAHLERHGALAPFHVLPVRHADRDCFRLCWGHYPSAEAARHATDLPAALASAGVFPTPVSAALE